ncbi:function [Seminavis robusta]|uniref:Function n=1 Tax=Seminavis robusta TaxID=568900 RepID=A0A9N8H5M4_9STRA|nr:function [Seminavis robusta]|eukprot:Sro147_g067770.1 function (466) ;mRNA; r:36732-38129
MSEPSTIGEGGNEVSLLVLGDGDFSYSLDLARHLVTSSTVSSVYKSEKLFHLVATGFDSLEALTSKYKDSNFLLTKLRGLDQSDMAAKGSVLRVTVHHNVNAIQSSPSAKQLPGIFPSHYRHRHVVFNHPHLGTEDAARHARFLCHLFHSVSTVWLGIGPKQDDDDGWFHLTLVQGQFERWKCQQAAERHNMVLADSRPFRAPQVDNPYYHHRRHQTGKSFASRTPDGSVTYTFRQRRNTNSDQEHQQDDTTTPVLVAALLDLELNATTGRDDGHSGDSKNIQQNKDSLPFPCPHCDKRFKEERSRKCHVKAVHENKKRKRAQEDITSTTTIIYACNLCCIQNPETGTNGPRIFQSAQALEDHNKAKHFGKHDTIKPDWFYPTGAPVQNENHKAEEDSYGFCDICGLVFPDAKAQEDHEKQFLPWDGSSASSDEAQVKFQCSSCSKQFRDLRAQKQHENFCLHSS